MKLILKIIIFCLPVGIVAILYTNTTSVNQKRLEIQQKIQKINARLTRTNLSSRARSALQGQKILLANRMARHLGLANCLSLKREIPSLISGMYMTYEKPQAERFEMRYCDVGTSQDVVVESKISIGQQQAPQASTYFESFHLSANNSSTPVRKALTSIVQIVRVIPVSPQTPCPTSDYGFDEAGFWVKNRCQAQFMVLKAQATRYIDALEPRPPVFKGEITHVRQLANNQVEILGWSCEVGHNSPLELQLYFGDAGTTGVYMASTATVLDHSSAISGQCQTSAGAKHNFSFVIDTVEKSTHSLEQKANLRALSQAAGSDHIFVYAVAHKENGFSMHKLAGSGVLRHKIGDIKGWVDRAVIENNQLVVRGWACHVDDPRSLSVDVYYGNQAGQSGAVMLGRKMANISHESAISQTCKGGGVAHRYAAQFPLANSGIPAGSPLYVYGINLLPGKTNTLLAGSGTITTPTINLQWNNLGKGWNYFLGAQRFNSGQWDSGLNCLQANTIAAAINTQVPSSSSISFPFNGDCVSAMIPSGVANPRISLNGEMNRLRVCASRTINGVAQSVCSPFTSVTTNMSIQLSLRTLFSSGFWVNKIGAETQAQTCARVGMSVGADQGKGICASGELRPNVGPGSMLIEYVQGTWGAVTSGGTSVVENYCYATGQKRDNNKTDLTVAYWCK